MAVVAKGARSARSAAAKHRKASATPREPLTPRKRQVDDEPSPVLPVPPTDAEKYSYVRRHVWMLSVFAALSVPPLLYGQVRMVLNSTWFYVYVPFALFGVLCFLLSVTADGMSRGFDLAEHKRIVAGWRPLWYPSVDVFLPVCGEPLEVLRNAWTHVAQLRRPVPRHRHPVRPRRLGQPADQGDGPPVRLRLRDPPEPGLVQEVGQPAVRVRHLGQRLHPAAGRRLRAAAGPARRDPAVHGHAPRRRDRADPAVLPRPRRADLGRARGRGGTGAVLPVDPDRQVQRDAAICVGSCAVYRRKALEDEPGMSLAEHSEDLHTGFDLRRMGWRLRYIPIALSTGNCPDNILAFLNQQYRWCSGTMSLLGARGSGKTKLPLCTRLCYMSGFLYYINTALFAFVIPAAVHRHAGCSTPACCC